MEPTCHPLSLAIDELGQERAAGEGSRRRSHFGGEFAGGRAGEGSPLEIVGRHAAVEAWPDLAVPRSGMAAAPMWEDEASCRDCCRAASRVGDGRALRRHGCSPAADRVLGQKKEPRGEENRQTRKLDDSSRVAAEICCFLRMIYLSDNSHYLILASYATKNTCESSFFGP